MTEELERIKETIRTLRTTINPQLETAFGGVTNVETFELFSRDLTQHLRRREEAFRYLNLLDKYFLREYEVGSENQEDFAQHLDMWLSVRGGRNLGIGASVVFALVATAGFSEGNIIAGSLATAGVAGGLGRVYMKTREKKDLEDHMIAQLRGDPDFAEYLSQLLELPGIEKDLNHNAAIYRKTGIDYRASSKHVLDFTKKHNRFFEAIPGIEQTVESEMPIAEFLSSNLESALISMKHREPLNESEFAKQIIRRAA